MIFVDTSVLMYAVGKPHPLRESARNFFREQHPLCTSAQVLQELIHAYLPVNRGATLDAAFSLVARSGIEVWPIEPADVHLARQLHDRYPTLSARDLIRPHLEHRSVPRPGRTGIQPAGVNQAGN